MVHSNSRGVRFDAKWNKWTARIADNGERVFLGGFDTQIEARNAYRDYASKMSVPNMNIAGATPEMLAWAAGLIDGEGTIIIIKAKPSPSANLLRYQLRVAIGMTHRATVEHIRSIFNRGYITVKKKHDKQKHDHFIWMVTVHNAACVLKLALPYLVTKRSQAELAIEFENSISPCIRTDEEMALRESFYIKMRQLKIVDFE